MYCCLYKKPRNLRYICTHTTSVTWTSSSASKHEKRFSQRQASREERIHCNARCKRPETRLKRLKHPTYISHRLDGKLHPTSHTPFRPHSTPGRRFEIVGPKCTAILSVEEQVSGRRYSCFRQGSQAQMDLGGPGMHCHC